MKGNLLLVDDEEVLLRKLKLNLEDLADTVDTASNGAEALEAIQKGSYHCIVCDINMPKMNGVEFLKALRKLEIKVPFIFYTGHGNKDLLLEAAKYGAFDFLDKPMLDGLEEVVSAGLKLGLNGNEPGKKDTTDFSSEYSKLLASLETGQK